jgi:hypothetical protein
MPTLGEFDKENRLRAFYRHRHRTLSEVSVEARPDCSHWSDSNIKDGYRPDTAFPFDVEDDHAADSGGANTSMSSLDDISEAADNPTTSKFVDMDTAPAAVKTDIPSRTNISGGEKPENGGGEKPAAVCPPAASKSRLPMPVDTAATASAPLKRSHSETLLATAKKRLAKAKRKSRSKNSLKDNPNSDSS